MKEQYLKSYMASNGYSPIKIMTQYFLYPFIFGGARHYDWFSEKGYGKPKEHESTDAFENFMVAQRKPGAIYHNAFNGLNVKRDFINSKLAHSIFNESEEKDVKECNIETINFSSSDINSPFQKHMICFHGAGKAHWQPYMRGLALTAKNLNINVHSFNYPGIAGSTGEIYEFNDLVNSGIAVVNSLLTQGKDPGNIVLQGHCVGSNVALAVKNFFAKEHGVELKLLMFDAPKSLSHITVDTIDNIIKFLPSSVLEFLSSFIDFLLQNAGWVVISEDFQTTETQVHFYQGDNNLSINIEHTLHYNELCSQNELITQIYNNRFLVPKKSLSEDSGNTHFYSFRDLQTEEGILALEQLRKFILS